MINNRQGGRRRGRGGSGSGSGGPPRGMNVGSGNRQDNRQRGNAAQLHEKYKGLARDAQMQGDRVLTETYLQYADHYFRVLGESRSRFDEHRRQRDDSANDDYDDGEDEQELEAGDGGQRYAEEQEPREEQPRGEFRPRREEPVERAPRAERFQRDDRPERPERTERFERADRPAPAERLDRDRPERTERNGEVRARPARAPRREAAAAEDNGNEARIAFDSLPPAIATTPARNDETPPSAPRARRPRRPREDEDIAPAA